MKLKSLSKLNVIATLFCLTLFQLTAFSQSRIAENLASRMMDYDTQNVELMTYNAGKTQDNSLTSIFAQDFIEKAEFFVVDINNLQNLKSNNAQIITLDIIIPGSGLETVTLFQDKVLSEDFSAVNSLGEDLTDHLSDVLFYRGIVNAYDNSIVTLTLFEDEIAGVISIGAINYNLGKIKDASQHIIYRDVDLDYVNDFVCSAADPAYTDPIDDKPFNGAKSTLKCVKVRAEIDADLNSSLGGSAASMTYAAGLFNELVTLFSNDDIDIALSEVFVWEGSSPYSGDILGQMSNDSPNADLTALLTQQFGGGVAWLAGLCSVDFGNSVNGVDGFFNSVPTYSWDVNVTAHELGHNLDSPHTHACAWNGNNTAIDGCGPNANPDYSEGCSGSNPPEGGTIMSYCHLTGVGVDFSLGFGPQPAARIANYINSRPCLDANCGPEGVQLDLVAVLEGPYDLVGGLMTDNLRIGDHIPLTEPYSAMGFSVPSVSTTNAILSVSGFDAVVDWVLVQVRSVTNPATILESQAALIQRDGDIIAADGSSLLSFPTVSDANVYVAILHRNHLGVRTADPQSTSTTIDLDFSSLSFNYTGNNGMLVVDGKHVLVAGDANGDGQVNNVDKNIVWRPLNGQPYTYSTGAADYDLNSGTNAIDNNLYWRKNNSVTSGLE